MCVCVGGGDPWQEASHQRLRKTLPLQLVPSSPTSKPSAQKQKVPFLVMTQPYRHLSSWQADSSSAGEERGGSRDWREKGKKGLMEWEISFRFLSSFPGSFSHNWSLVIWQKKADHGFLDKILFFLCNFSGFMSEKN